MNEQRTTYPSSSSTKFSDGQIIELPLLRKQTIVPLNKSLTSASSVGASKGTRNSHFQSATSSFKIKDSIPSTCINNDPDAWVDLEADASMTMQLQVCIGEDEAAFEYDKRIIFDHPRNVPLSTDIPALSNQSYTPMNTRTIVNSADNCNIEVTLKSSLKRNLFRISDEESLYGDENETTTTTTTS